MSIKQSNLFLKLDDAANTAAYNEALLYFEGLGFRGKTASDLAIEKVHNNVLFDAGTLPDVNVVAKAWGDGDDDSRRENYQKARKAERESLEKALQHEMNQSIRNATDKWGYSIGSGLEMISGFTPLWWVAPATRTGLDLSKGNYKGAALNAGLAFAAPYAVSKAFQHGSNLYRGYKSMTNPNNVYEVMAEAMIPVKTSSAGVWTNRGTRSAKISEAERLGIPKGMGRTIVNNELEILANAKAFAEKYGYEVPETIDAAKAMYKRHNSWFRTVLTDALYDNSKYGLAFTDPKLQTLPKTESAKILASRGYPAAYRSPGSYEPGIYLDDFVFASPSMAENTAYLGGEGVYTVMLQRPFSLRNPLDWHNAADYRPISKYIYEPLKVGLTQIGNAGPKHEIKLATKHLIPVKMAKYTDKGTLLGEYLGNVTYKSGGSIHIKKGNKGKFSKVRDYVDYKNKLE